MAEEPGRVAWTSAVAGTLAPGERDLLGQWDEALGLNAAIAASKRDRRAPADAIARTRFNDYGPLLRLGRADDALALLEDCLRAFQDAGDSQATGSALSGLADAEDTLGEPTALVEEVALEAWSPVQEKEKEKEKE